MGVGFNDLTMMMVRGKTTASPLTLPYGSSKEWLEQNGDTSQLYQINGYVWAYIESNGWTQSGTQFLVVSSEDEMTSEGGTAYLLREGDTGTVYAYTEASGDADVPVYDSLPETANEGDIVAVGDRKYQASLTTVAVEHNAYDPNTAKFNYRLNSGGEEKSYNGGLLLDYAEVSYDTSCIVTVSGIDGLAKNYSSYVVANLYDANKEHIGQLNCGLCCLPTSSANVSNSFDGTLPLAFRLFVSTSDLPTGVENTAYVRIKLGIKTATSATDTTAVISAADVEGLVVNISTLNTTTTETVWTDIGAYLAPVSGGWSATDETCAVIDSLSDTANSGDSAVYSADGYLYSYIAGAAWVQTSKYNAPTLAIDGALSTSSTNAVQNRIVAAAIDAVDVKVKANAEEINAINDRVANVETGSDTLTIPSWWQDAVDECVTKVKALQVGRNCVTFPFFSDNHENTGYAGVLIAAVMKECGIPYCFFGGDAIGSSLIPDEATMVSQDKRFDDMMSPVPEGRFCRAVGNHDGFWKVSTSEKYSYTRAQVYELFLRNESLAQNKHLGGDGTYYYVDDMASKVRFIVLDTNSQPIGAGSEVIDSDQLTWLQNTALSFNESGWGVVIISHCPIANPYHANVTNATEVINIMKNYIAGTDTNKADVIGWFSGHIHRDRIYTNLYVNGDSLGYVGEPDIELGFTQVTIASDNVSIVYGEAAEKGGTIVVDPMKQAIGDDDTSHAIDFITINKDTRTVNLTRLGGGGDRSYTY